jgi:hypothetical protein
MAPFPNSCPSLTNDPPGTAGTRQPIAAGMQTPRLEDERVHASAQRQNTVKRLLKARDQVYQTPQLGCLTARTSSRRRLS